LLPSPAAAAPEAVSLVKRIQHLRALLLRLSKLGPSYARRVAPELLILRNLLGELLPPEPQVNPPSYPASSLLAGYGAVGPAPVAGLSAPLGAVATQAPILNEYVPEAAGSRVATASPASGVRSPRVDTATSRPGAAPAAPQAPALLMDVPVSTGSSSSASAAGAAAAGTAAGTLATLCAVCLFLGLLSDRLTLIVLPWRLAVLGHRLERPG